MRSWPSPSIPLLPGSPLPLSLFDSAEQRLRPTAAPKTARMYVCGITPYDATHLGHANTYVTYDLLQRVWRDAGHDVEYVQNVTDIDDPLLERAAATGADWEQLADEQTELFRDDMTALRVLAPRHLIGAVEAMPLVIQRTEQLRDAGATYSLDGDLYYRIASDPRFGQVSGLDREQMLEISAERGGDPGREGKEDPLDPLLWLAARPGEPSWDSPFGKGRPGWHLECVAIALEYLGMGFDVQGGGSDLVFPHHEMGAAQACTATGEFPYARVYSHSGMVALDGAKMSKSKGNLVFVSKLLQDGVDPMAIRLLLLAHHYRSDWEYKPERLAAANERLATWRAAVSLPTGPDAHPMLADMRAALADDLNAPGALKAMDRWAHSQLTRGGEDPAGPGVASRSVDALLGVAL